MENKYTHIILLLGLSLGLAAPSAFAGGGGQLYEQAAQAYKELRRLSEALGIPVATSSSGKGTFAETHDLALGVYGTFGTATANAPNAPASRYPTHIATCAASGPGIVCPSATPLRKSRSLSQPRLSTRSRCM